MIPIEVKAAAVAILLLGCSVAEAQTVRVTTWNLQWFPNGSPKEESPSGQNANITRAAEVLRKLDPDILLLQEVKDWDACTRLAEAIKSGTYHVAVVSAFNEGVGQGRGKQQVAILAKEHAQAAWSEPWKSIEDVDPPRGFAFAWFRIRNADIGVYSLHLKSNLIMRSDKEAEAARNIRKREVSVEQLLVHTRDVIGTAMPMVKAVVVGGDFNTNVDQQDFADEKTLKVLTEAGFKEAISDLPFAQRITHPGSHGFPDATFDYLFYRGASAGKPLIHKAAASDHYPVTVDLAIEGLRPAPVVAQNARAIAPAAAPQHAPQQGAPTAVRITRDTAAALRYGTTTLRAGVEVEVLGPPVSGQLRVRYLGQLYTLPVANTNYPAFAVLANAPAAPQPTPQLPQPPTTPAVAAPAKPATAPSASPSGTPPAPDDDLRDIPNVSVEQLLAEEGKFAGKIVSLSFRFRGAKAADTGEHLEAEIIDMENVPGKKAPKKFTIAARVPKVAANWFNRVPVKTSGDERGQLTAAFARVAAGKKGQVVLELIGNRKQTDMSGTRIDWTGL